jgi:RHS repeat-associated protein
MPTNARLSQMAQLSVGSNTSFVETTRALMVQLTVLVSLYVLLAGPAHAIPRLAAASSQGLPGAQVSVPVQYTSDGTVVALQFDATFDAQALSFLGVQAGSVLGSHSIDAEEIAPGQVRVVVSTPTFAVLATGALAQLRFAISIAAIPGSYPVLFDDVVLADGVAAAVLPSQITAGAVVVAAGVPAEPEPIPALGLISRLVLVFAMGLMALRFARSRQVAGFVLAVGFSALLAFDTQAQTVPGDANNDGIVNAADIATIVAEILQRVTAPGDPDCNQDGLVNVLDTVCVVPVGAQINLPPVLTDPGDRLVSPDSDLAITLLASDPNPGDQLVFGLVVAPPGMTLDANTGLLNWRPSQSDLGANTVTITVTDPGGLSDQRSFIVEVVEFVITGLGNRAPMLSVPDGLDTKVGNTVQLMATATDPDPGDVLTFQLTQRPSGMVINGASGAISWTPGPTQVGAYDVAVKVADPAGAAALGSFVVRVSDTNRAPLASDDVYEARLGKPLTVAASGLLANDSDPDGDPLSARLLGDVGEGALTLNADGSFDYLLEPPDRSTPVELEKRCSNAFATGGRYYGEGTVAIGDVDNDGELEIVGTRVLKGFTFKPEVWVMSAVDCSEKYETGSVVEDAGAVYPGSHLGLHDIDGDGDLEIIGLRERYPLDSPENGAFDRKHLIAINYDGTLAWPGDGGSEDSPQLQDNLDAKVIDTGPTFADINGDGSVEIIMGFHIGINFGVYSGVVVYNAEDGSLLWDYLSETRQGAGNQPRMPYVVDLDLDGTMEIIIHNNVLDHNGQLEFILPSRVSEGTQTPGHLTLGIANFDDDPYPELIGRDEFHHYLFEHDGTIKWQQDVRNAARGQMSVADFDGDGAPEFAYVTCLVGNPDPTNCVSYYLAVFDTDGSVLWSHQESSEYHLGQFWRGSTNITAFDANRDGAFDLVFRNDDRSVLKIFIFSGRDGSELASVPSATSTNYAQRFTAVVDLDGDGHAEIINSGWFAADSATDIWTGTAENPLPAAPRQRHQWNFLEAYVEDNAAIPTNPLPHWLQPGRNGYHLITPEPDPLVGTTETFTYVASDGELDSAPATVTLDILPAGNPPRFLSVPDTRTTRGFSYRYNPVVVDPDLGDSVTFQLTAAPAGMTLDVATGEINWLPDANGEYAVSILALDTIGFATPQSYTLEVGDPVVVPDVVGQSQGAAQSSLEAANFRVGRVREASHPALPVGSVIELFPIGGSIAGFGATVALTVSTGPAPEDTDADGDGFTPNQGDCNDGEASVYPGAPDPLGDGIDQDCDGVDGSQPVAEIRVVPGAPVLLAGEQLALTAFGIFGDGSAQTLTGAVTWAASPSGAVTVSPAGQLVAGTTAGSATVSATRNGVTGSASVTVVARDSSDVQPPEVRITTPVEGDVVSQPATVLGTVSDSNLVRYRLEISPSDENRFQLVGEGDSSVIEGTLGVLDPTVLLNGLYTLRLTALDAGGNVSSDSVTVRLDGFLKVGNFNVAFKDADLPVGGVPLELIRSYDSRNLRPGDFGIGWELSYQSVRISCVEPLGEGWTVLKSGISFLLREDRLHACTVEIPGQRAEVFDFVPSATVSPIVPFSFLSGSFRARAGTRGTLVNLDGNNLLVPDSQPGPVQLLDDTDLALFTPQRFRYTYQDGSSIDFESGNVTRIADLSGNSITFSAAGMVHSSGRSFEFTRDDSGRITRITDPLGQSQEYAYSASGDLVRHTDVLGNVTRYFYNDRHGLLRIDDPLDRPALRNSYDDAGRLLSTTEADGRQISFDYNADLRRQTITDVDGATTIIETDAFGNVTTEIDALGGQTVRSYDGQGNLLSETDPNGNTTQFTYDVRGNVLSETNPDGGVTQYAYDSRGNLTDLTDPLGRVTRFTYGANGQLLSRRNALGIVEDARTYHANGRLASRTDGLGNSTEFTYNGFGDLTQSVDARGNVQLFNYDANGWLSSRTDPLGATTQFVRNARGDIVEETDALGRTTRLEYDALGQVTQATDATGATYRYEYDAKGNQTAVVDALGGRLSSEHDLRSNVLRTVSPGGQVSSFAYDALDRQVQIQRTEGQHITLEYDPAGNVRAQVDALGNRVAVSYDANGRREVLTDAAGHTLRLVRDGEGNIIGQTDPNGNATSFVHDAVDRPQRAVMPDGGEWRVVYDAADNVIRSIDPLGHQTDYAYDGNGNLIVIREPLGNETRLEYDASNRLTAIEDGNGRRTLMQYDAAGQMTLRSYPDGTVERWAYDAAGRVASYTAPNGDVSQLEYDANGRLTGKAYADGQVESFAYDADGQLIAASNAAGTVNYSYNDQGLLETLENPDGSAITYDYDANGGITAIATRTPGEVAARTMRMEYDERQLLERVEDPDGAVTTYSHDPIGNVSAVQYANGVRAEYRYDSLNRLDDLLYTSGGEVLEHYTYQFDLVGNRIRVTLADGSAIHWAYDAQRRLTRETHFDGNAIRQREISYEYDAVGNRVRTVDLEGTETRYDYNVADQLVQQGTTTFTYDPNGNLRSRSGDAPAVYTFDARNRLTAIQRPVDSITYDYDARGERVRRSVNGVARNYLVGIARTVDPSQVLAEYDASGARLAENSFVDRLLSRRVGGELFYGHTDASRNVRFLSDATGSVSDRYDYDAFGSAAMQTGDTDNPYRFAGERLDATEQLSYLRARYYQPGAGRFVSRDPFGGSPERPPTLHRYLYAENNPLVRFDPTGEITLAEKLAVFSVASAVIGIGFNSLFDVRSTAQELKGKTDQFRVKFCRGLLLGEGFAGLGLTALIAENEDNLRPEGATSANYGVWAFGVGWGIGLYGSNASGGEIPFQAPGTRNVSQFGGVGKMSSAGSSVVIAEAAAEMHTLPERSTFTVVGTSRGLSTKGPGAAHLTTFWELQGKNNALLLGKLDCYRAASK